MTYFIYGNLKVSPFFLKDSPVPGFELVTWDHQSWVYGTLYDIGDDAGFTPIGKDKVHGQVWRTDSIYNVYDLAKYSGVYDGLTEEVDLKVKIEDEGLEQILKATTFRLTEIKSEYNIVRGGHWIPKRI